MLCLGLMLFSCRKEMGNYSYHDINSCTIGNIDTAYTVLRGMPMKISPQLTFTQDNSQDTTKYSYRWYALDVSNTVVVRTELGSNKNLDWTVTLPSITKAYQVRYVVTEKATGQSWSKAFALQVNTNISDGWLILNENKQEARLDFYNYQSSQNTFQYYRDILSSQQSATLKGKPKMVYFYFRRDGFSGTTARSIVVGTDQETAIINTQNNTFSPYISLSKAMTSYFPAPYYAISVAGIGGRSFMSYLLDNLGQLQFENPTMGYTYGVRINKTILGEPVTISPYFAEGYNQGVSYALMYDVVKKRFLEHKDFNNASAVPSIPADANGTPPMFDPGNMNMDLMYMASTIAVTGQTYAVLKRADNKVFLARIICNASTFLPQAFQEIVSPDIANASLFAIDPQEGYLMYAVGSKVYRYNPYDKSSKMVIDAGDRAITLIKYQKLMYGSSDRYMDYSRKLIVCTYKPAAPEGSGKMELYTVPSLNGDLTLYQTFDGLDKIVDVTYRE